MSGLDTIQLNSNLSQESKNMKYIDIYLHLKTNIKNNPNLICQCNTKDKYYCIPCKTTCCSLCNLNQHQDHIIINMREYFLNSDNINKIFKSFSKNIKKSELILKSDELKVDLIKYIDETVDEIISKLEKFRKRQKEDIEKIFKNFEINKNMMFENIDDIHMQLNDYVNKNKQFFNLKNDKEKDNKFLNNDIHNTYFLQGYDIINLTNQDINKIYKIIDILEEDLQNHLDNQNENFSKIKSEIDKLVSINENDYNNKKNNKNHSLDLNTPIDHFIYTADDLGLEHFTNVKERINKYNTQIKNFKKALFKIIKQSGNLKAIEKNLKSIEFNKLKDEENLFSLRDQEKNGINDL